MIPTIHFWVNDLTSLWERAMRDWLVLAATLVATGVQAEPSPTVTKLIGQPVSMFEFGVIQLDAALRKDFEPQGYNSAVVYSWQENRIFIEVYLDAKSTFNPDLECPTGMSLFRNWGFVTDGAPTFPEGTRYSSYFVPRTFSIDTLSGARAELDRLFVVRLHMMKPDKQWLICGGPVLGTSYSVEK